MSKELEDRLKVLNEFEKHEGNLEHLSSSNILNVFNELENNLKCIENAYKDRLLSLIKKALTPPTADEVCKALSECEKRNVFYSEDTQEFYYLEYEGKNGEYSQFITETYGDGLWTLGVYLPPHLITLIGRFYEELEK